ncbi:hypothetical protein Agub_g12193 [Astrephomene gubernaculifera]|uniref:AAA+ ATPase domain-containing protein n=1 Tax=Astrephomene gubernaculifera TaxID=47775 RepID=A0AAD3HRD4_9CHLO|nr:hypothetical protein Agub_g12193 [Astrephomene gubernaculifera]
MDKRRVSGGNSRKFFDKVTLNKDVPWDPRRDGPKFMLALLEYSDPVEMLYRLTNPNEHGAARLKSALTADGSPSYINSYVAPLLKKLGGDELSGGTVRAPLLQLLEQVYRVPGLLGCLQAAVASGQLAEAAPVGWFLLMLATELDEVRRSPEVRRLADLLAAQGGDGAKVAQRLHMVLAGAAEAAAGAGAAGVTGGRNNGATTRASARARDGSGSGRRQQGAGIALEDLLAGPGGRHDNDHVDYRSIQILTTSDEALCERPPYLPRRSADDEAEDGELPGPSPHLASNPEAALLDRHFRLLREDFVQPLRQALAVLGLKEGAGKGNPAAAGQPRLQERLAMSVSFVQRNVFPLVAVVGVAHKPRACVQVAVALPPGHRAMRLKKEEERKEYWSEYGKGTLPMDALVCIARMPKKQAQAAGSQQPQPQPLLFGTVVRREAAEMARKHPEIGLVFERGQQAGAARLLSELGRGERLEGEELALVQVSTSFPFIRPVLACLQSMTGVPLAEELVAGRQPGHVTYLQPGAVQEELSYLQSRKLVLDPSQREALQRCLTQRVALVQGPPGTGKTFIGALLCDAIVRRSSETILVVCYTNHALDQFLEALIAKGITSIVRIGSRSKNKALAKYNLRELTSADSNGQRPRLPPVVSRRMWVLKTSEEELDRKAKRLKQLLFHTAGPFRHQDKNTEKQQPQEQQQPGKQSRKGAAGAAGTDAASQQPPPPPPPAGPAVDLWRELEEFLADEHEDAWEQLMGFEIDAGGESRWHEWLRGLPSPTSVRDPGYDDGWQASKAAQKKAAAGSISYNKAEELLFEQAAALRPAVGSGAGSNLSGMGEVSESGDLWRLPLPQRLQLAARWLRELRGRWAAELATSLARFRELQAEIRALHDDRDRAVLSGARVIGVTSTGAAMHKELLGAVGAGVVLVEEAGELLEAHVLTSAGSKTQHLIMIGDHKQLRPKVDCWSLAVQSGCGHDLNVSLFERLVLAGFPHTPLAVQHRMHPQVSALVRPTYPALVDAEAVGRHPPLRGLQPGRRVVFVDHREPELGEKEGGMWGAAAAGQVSKVNPHEVALVREVVRYLLRQGYGAGQLVVLTPYLGQLLELQRELSRDMQVLLDELDLSDLRAAAKPQALEGLAESTGPDKPAAGGKGGKAGGGGGGGSGVRIATIDNYQGEESDVVIASLVRSNDAGSVGFLREPERINVLLSRARHGMLLIGNSHTLRHAKHPEARRHWGRVLDALEAEGGVLPGLPVACQRHGTVALLESPAAFAQHAPDGGCRRPCQAVLKCGHPCTLRCHAYDPDHERVVCGQEVLDVCSRGHSIVRRCSQRKEDSVCTICTEVRQVEVQERLELAKLEKQAEAQRKEMELQRARLQARISQLQQQAAALEEQRRSRQEAVRLELEALQLGKQVELQRVYGAVELADWEREQRQEAAAQMKSLEADARLEAQRRKEEKAMQAQQREEEQRRRQLEKAAQELQNLEEKAQREMQQIVNDKRRLETQAQERRGAAEAKEGGKLHQYRTMSAWKEAVAKAAEAADGGGEGLSALRQQIRASAAGSQEAARDTAGSLDAVFSEPGLGGSLVAYVGADAEEEAAELARSGGSGGSIAKLRRGLALIQERKWLDAYKYFSATIEHQQKQQQQKQESAAAMPQTAEEDDTVDDATAALFAICRVKSGLPAESENKGQAVRARPSATSKGRAGPKSRPLSQKPSQQAAGSSTASGLSLSQAVGHLAAALMAVQQRAGAAGPARDIATVQLQRTADARAAGSALAYLLHPLSGQLPAVLREEALGLLREMAPVLSGPLRPGPSAAAPSSSSKQLQWEARAKSSPALSKLLQLTGLAPVKQAMFQLAAMVDLDKERGRDLGAKQYNVRFYGNPGTGKTTVARMYAELLKELRVLPGAEVVETSGSELLTGGVSKLKEQLGKLEKGGVLFLDEAYQLNPKTNPMGAQVLDYLLPEMENRRGKLVVVLAGYKKQLEELMAHNEGLPSRFVQEFNFPDYSDEELFIIFRDLIASDTDPRFTVADERHLRIAARRLGRQRGMVGFGNARAVRNAYEQAQRRQSARVLSERGAGLQPDPLLLVREDLLGPKQLDVSSCEALRELQGMRGLAEVKQQVADLLGLIRTNAELEEQERPLKAVNLNRIFLGNPGTGKTTVAGLYGRILRDLGLLSKGDVEVRVPADFVGSVLGESEKRTEAILEATKGRVLVIDEAYGLHSAKGTSDPYRVAVIDTLVARVQGVPGDDRCVLLLGYEEQMEAMMREANPGLARRFQMREAWRFQDYGPVDLLAITREAARKRGWELGEAALLAAVEALDQERRKPNFGNAGAVNNLLSTAAVRMEGRLRGLPPARRAAEVPQAEDFLPPRQGGAASDPAGIFGDLIGCREVLSKLREWQATILGCQAVGRDPLQVVELNFRFVGAPGTGKTTVAARVGRLFESLGLLASSELVSCSASDFVTGYANQAAGKTREMFKKAVGGVLFIDEAYRLNPKHGGPYMQEVIDEIVQMLTEPAFMGKMVVILAGYEEQIEELMRVNPGLKSRFSQRLHFPDFTPADAASLLRLQLRRDYGMELAAEAEAQLEGMAAELASAPNWSNGRDVGTWAKRTFAAACSRSFGPQAPAAAAAASGGPGGQAQQQPQQQTGSLDPGVILADLRSALDTLLVDKRGPKPRQQQGRGIPPILRMGASEDGGDGDEGADGGTVPPSQQQPAYQYATATDMATARAPQPQLAPPAVRSEAAPAVAEPPVEQAAATAVAAQEGAAGGKDFGSLSPAFLEAMQETLEALGHDLTSMDAVQELAGDPSLASQLLPYLAVPGVTDVAVLREMVRQWQMMLAKRMEEERELAKKKQRPVWRCAVCGRYGCPVAPYIERYEEF